MPRLQGNANEAGTALRNTSMDIAGISRLSYLESQQHTITAMHKSGTQPPVPARSSALTGLSLIGLAIGATAVGATAVGALAIGALAIGKLALRSAHIEKLSIGELTVDRLVVKVKQPTTLQERKDSLGEQG